MVKIKNLVKTWWIHQVFWNFVKDKELKFCKNKKPGENLVNSPGFVEFCDRKKTWWNPGGILCNLKNLVTTWWIHQVLWNFVKKQPWWIHQVLWKPGWIHQVFEKITKSESKKCFVTLKLTKRSALSLFLVKIIRFDGKNPRKNLQGGNLVKTWWIHQASWNFVKDKNVVKTWWICKILWKIKNLHQVL